MAERLVSEKVEEKRSQSLAFAVDFQAVSCAVYLSLTTWLLAPLIQDAFPHLDTGSVPEV